MASGDLNNDEIPDIAIVFNGGYLYIINGTSGGGLSPKPWNISLASKSISDVRSIDLGDLNGDGRNDIAISHAAPSNRITILYQNNGFNLLSSTDLPVAAEPYQIVVGEFSNDQYNDVAVVLKRSPTNWIYIYRYPFTVGGDDGRFIQIPSFSNSQILTTGYINGDSKLDLLVCNRSGQNAYCFFQPATVTDWVSDTWSQQLLTIEGQIIGAQLSDLTGTGRYDLVILNEERSRIEIRKNNLGNLNDNSPVFINGFTGIQSFAIGHHDSDSGKDITILNRVGNNCSVFLQSTSGGWNTTPSYRLPTPEHPIRALVRGDGLDLCILSKGSGNGGFLSVYDKVNGAFSSAEKDEIIAGAGPKSIDAGSVRYHQKVIASALTTDHILIYDVDTEITRYLPAPSPLDIKFGDFNGDGYDDIAVILGGLNKIRVFDGSSNLLSASYSYHNLSVPLPSAAFLATGEPANTGGGDVLVVGCNGGVVVFFNAMDINGANETVGTSFPGNRDDVIVGNFNLDGHGGDIACINRQDGQVEIFKRNPTGNPVYFPERITLNKASHIGVSLTAGYFDNDNLMDLAMGTASSKIAFYNQSTNNGGFFQGKSSFYSIDTSPMQRGIFSGDLNDDGLSDILIARSDLPVLSLYLNRGTLGYLNSMNFTTGCNAADVFIGDLNGDGRLDVASASTGSSSIGLWFQNNLAPKASGPQASYNIIEGQTIDFDASASTDSFSDRSSLQYYWHFGDGGSSTNKITSNRYLQEGTYNGYLKVTDRGGLSNTKYFQVIVADIDPIADFTFSPTNPVEGAIVQFTDTSVHYDAVTYLWSFGDGNTSIQKNPTHTYRNDGTYQVRLTIAEADGDVSWHEKTIIVSDVSPIAVISSFSRTTQTILENDTIPLRDASISHDPIINWEWNFGDGSPVDNNRNTSHRYPVKGTYNVTLTVWDADGWSVDWFALIVADRPPTPQFSMSATQVLEGQAVQFTDQSYAYDGIKSWFWQFGDGNTSTSQNPTHAFRISGSIPVAYTVTLTVTDNDDISRQTSKQITLLPSNPTIISFLASGGKTVFNEDDVIALEVIAQPSFVPIQKYEWDFNYDPTVGFNPVPGISSNSTTTSYSIAREFTICVRVYDYNSYVERTAVITVRNVAPTANLTYIPTSTTSFIFDASKSTDTPSDSSSLMFRWNFGDGSGWTSWSTSPTAERTFTDGVYNVMVQVRDDNGATDSETRSVIVDTLPPSIGLNGSVVTSAYAGDKLIIEVRVTDLSGVSQVILYYSIDGKNYSVQMVSVSGTDRYIATIVLNQTGQLSYYVTATDIKGYSAQLGVIHVGISKRPDYTPFMVIAALVASAFLGAFVFLRRRSMVIDEVFIIYKDGNLIAHQTRRLKPGMDDQILGSMLVAIQNFVRDSFKDEASTGLNRMDFGEKKVLVEKGDHIYLAVVLHGKREGKVPQRMRASISRAENDFHDVLRDWDGDLDKVRGIKDRTDPLIRSRIIDVIPRTAQEENITKAQADENIECPVCDASIALESTKCPNCGASLTMAGMDELAVVADEIRKDRN